VANSESDHWFTKVATRTATNSGRPWAFAIAILFVIGWLISGPRFHFQTLGNW
jgi:low affinity Fe/Cu permease